MANDIFERLGASAPVNRQAALSTAKGFSYEPSKTIIVREWEAPPKLKYPTRKHLDLTGVRFGRLTVVGIDAEKAMTKNTIPTWVCRCDCGRYTSRRAKAIKNPRNADDRCSLCLHAQFLQKEARRLG